MLLHLSRKPETVQSTTLSTVQPGLQNTTAAALLKKSFQHGQAKLEVSPVNKVLNFTLGWALSKVIWLNLVLTAMHQQWPLQYCDWSSSLLNMQDQDMDKWRQVAELSIDYKPTGQEV
jgi:hypothetical protein